MVTGDLDIRLENAAPAPHRTYKVRFQPLGEHGAVVHQKDFEGDHSIREFFFGLQDKSMTQQRREYWANQWLLDLRSRESLALGLVTISIPL